MSSARMQKSSLSGDFEKELRTARRSAGNSVGRKAVSERKRRIGKASARRKKAIRHAVGKDGFLTLLDLAPLARATDYGETISAKGGKGLLVRTGVSLGGKMFRSKDGKYLFRSDGNNKKTLLGTFRKSISIKARPQAERFEGIADKYADQYADEIEKRLAGGFK